MEQEHTLPDVLAPGLKLIICGTAAGDRSFEQKAYYAQPGNQFWDVLYRTGLTPEPLKPADYEKLKDLGIGLTDLAKFEHGMDRTLLERSFDVEAFRSKIEANAPRVVAFNGKKAAETFYRHAVEYGPQRESIGHTVVFVLPSTSGAARAFWDISYWQQCADYVNRRHP